MEKRHKVQVETRYKVEIWLEKVRLRGTRQRFLYRSLYYLPILAHKRSIRVSNRIFAPFKIVKRCRKMVAHFVLQPQLQVYTFARNSRVGFQE